MKSILESVKAAVGVVVSVFAGMHYMIQLLVYAIAMDITTGLLVAWAKRNISSEVSRVGMARKAMMLLAVGGAELVSKMAGISVSTPWDTDFSLGVALAGYYCVHEAISTTENISKLGVPLPKFLLKRLEALKKMDEES